MTDTIVSLSDLVCAQCGNTIDVQPGEIYIGSTDGRVWHYGCKSRNAMSEEVGELDPLVLDDLRNRRLQIDWDGVDVGVSRRCLDETLAYLEALQARLAEVTGENRELKEAVIAFAGPWAAQWAREHDLPESHLHSQHYDLLERCGARMDDFNRAALSPSEEQK